MNQKLNDREKEIFARFQVKLKEKTERLNGIALEDILNSSRAEQYLKDHLDLDLPESAMKTPGKALQHFIS